MTIGFSLGSLIQQEQDGQKGMIAGTTWDPSLGMSRDSFDKMKQKKKVTFSKETLEAYKTKQQNNRQNKGSHPRSFQLEQLGSNNVEQDELPEQNNKMTATQTCWNSFQQDHQMQQQPAPTLAKKLQHRTCTTNSLDDEDDSLEEEDRALGSFEAHASGNN